MVERGVDQQLEGSAPAACPVPEGLSGRSRDAGGRAPGDWRRTATMIPLLQVPAPAPLVKTSAGRSGATRQGGSMLGELASSKGRPARRLWASTLDTTVARRHARPMTPRHKESRHGRSCAPATSAWTCLAHWSPRPRRDRQPGRAAAAGDRGAAAVVLPSLFEEQLTLEADQAATSWSGQPVGGAGPGRLQRRRLPGPGRKGQGQPADPGDRQPQRRHPRHLGQARQPAGGGRADALELNIYYVSSSPRVGGAEIERRYLELVGSVRQTIGIPGGQAQPVFQLRRQPDPPARPGRRRRAGAVQPLLPARPRPGDPGGHSPGPVHL